MADRLSWPGFERQGGSFLDQAAQGVQIQREFDGQHQGEYNLSA